MDSSNLGVYVVGDNFNFDYNYNNDVLSWINLNGYQNGSTKYRSLSIGNGKGAAIATFDGPTGNVYSEALTEYSGTSSINGFSSYSTKSIIYKRLGKTVTVYYNIFGTSTNTNFSFSLPHAINSMTNYKPTASVPVYENNTVYYFGGYLDIAGSTVTLYNVATGGWTFPGTKGAIGQFSYETA